MKLTLKQRMKNIRQSHDYRLEKAKLEFIQGVTRIMQQKEITNAELARRLETSPAYITKVMRGDTNFTLDSLVKITYALDSKVHIHVADTSAKVRWTEAFSFDRLADNEPSQKARKVVKHKEALDFASILEDTADEAGCVYA